MNLSQVVTPDGEAAILQERHVAYVQKAVRFLEQTFAGDAAMSLLPARRAFVEQVYRIAQLRGLRREADHLRYLGVAVYWGAYFDTDPQHAPSLRRAGWIGPDGSARRGDFDMLYRAVSRWHGLAACECEDPDFVLTQLRIAKATVGGTVSDAERILCDIWPDRLAVLSPVDRRTVTIDGLRRAEALGLQGGDVLVCAALGIHYGASFLEDARYQDFAAAVNSDASPEDRGFALARAIDLRWAAKTEAGA